ncbi:MAG: hypothetical protein AAF629_32700 [Chloroflexota bacterium]
MTDETFEVMLTGGHHNSLGRTIEVVDIVLANPDRLEDLYQCYFSADEVVRLRTSSALKRVSKEHPQWLEPYIDKLITEISQIDQASTQWTLANLFDTLVDYMSATQKDQAQTIMQNNLETHTDWIVLNNTMQTLADWAESDPALLAWLCPYLERLQGDSRKSVANRAKKLQTKLEKFI